MTSPRRRPDRPIESVELRITFRADRETMARIRRSIPTARVRGGICVVKIEAEQPGAVAEKAKVLLGMIRGCSRATGPAAPS